MAIWKRSKKRAEPTVNDVLRRPSFLEAGEPLLLSRQAMGTAVRLQEFLVESGLSADDVLTSPMSSMPLPIYTDFGILPTGQPRKRWAGTRAEFMWHPLMWLPPRVAGRYSIVDDEGDSELEDDDLWAIRVALELTVSGMYDIASGTWVDILAASGLDIEHPAHLARVRSWLDGEPDEILDAIDLSDYLDVDPPDWALQVAQAEREDLQQASWALIADDLLSFADDTQDPAFGFTPAESVQALRTVASLGADLLFDVPDHTEDGVSTGAGNEPHNAFLVRIYDLLEASPETRPGLANQVGDRLLAIREAYWPSVERMNAPDQSP